MLYKPFDYPGNVVLQPLRTGVYAVNLFERGFQPVAASAVAFKNASRGLYFRATKDLQNSDFVSLTGYLSNLSNFNSTCGIATQLSPLGNLSVQDGVSVEQDGTQALEFYFSTQKEITEGVFFVLAETADGQR